MVDHKQEARRAWGASPTGWTSAVGSEPGTPEFFRRAREFRDQREQPWLSELIPFAAMRGKRVLEIGFGPGYDAYTFLQNGAIYSGVDLTPENVDRTKRHLAYFGLAPDVRQGDAEQLPFPDAGFDVVYSNGVLHHVPDMAKAFREAARVLAPNGAFYVIVYNRRSLFYGLNVVLRHVVSGSWTNENLAQRRSRIECTTADAAPLVNVYSARELRKILAMTGFSVCSVHIRKFTWEDMPGSSRLSAVYRRVPTTVYDWIGRKAGWYLIARAIKKTNK